MGQPIIQRAVLNGVDGATDGNVWAVGNWWDKLGNMYPLILNGGVGAPWRKWPAPQIGTMDYLCRVSALPNGEAWAVGYYTPRAGNANFPLALHFDLNTRQWNVSNPLPQNVTPKVNRFYSIAAVTSTDVWAVGVSNDGLTPDQTLIEHWDGQNWTIINSPNPGGNQDLNALNGVESLPGDNAWTVGWWGPQPNAAGGSIVTQYDPVNKVWVLGTSVAAGNVFNVLNDVTAISPPGVWAVGWYASQKGPRQIPVIQRWNGTSWSLENAPAMNLGLLDLAILTGVTAAPGNVWAVGDHEVMQGPFFRISKALIFHRKAGKWLLEQDTDFNLGAGLADIAAIARNSNDVWAVGSVGGHCLTEHWDGTQWTVRPCPF